MTTPATILRTQRPLLLMLDYDGTLSPIVPQFDQATLSSEQEQILKRLLRLPHVQCAIVSGRSVAQLLGFLQAFHGENLLLVGLHGGELYNLQTQQFLIQPSNDYKVWIEHCLEHLQQQNLHKLPGIRLENKAYSLGMHYRTADAETAEKAKALFTDTVTALNTDGLFHLKPGKALIEATPAAFDKGQGVHHVLDESQKRFKESLFPVFIGDDVTDFDAFKVVLPLEGHAYYVGTHPPDNMPPVTGTLSSVDEVYAFLTQHFLDTTD